MLSYVCIASKRIRPTKHLRVPMQSVIIICILQFVTANDGRLQIQSPSDANENVSISQPTVLFLFICYYDKTRLEVVFVNALHTRINL